MKEITSEGKLNESANLRRLLSLTSDPISAKEPGETKSQHAAGASLPPRSNSAESSKEAQGS